MTVRDRSIDVREVVNAVGELLQAAAGDKPVSIMTGPEPAPDGGYCVVEIPGGDPLDADLGGEHGGWLRLRTVCVSHTRETAWMEATWLKHVLRNALLDRDIPIAGEKWIVTGRRHDADAGTEYQGASVNSWDDYGLLVEPVDVPPEPPPPPPPIPEDVMVIASTTALDTLNGSDGSVKVRGTELSFAVGDRPILIAALALANAREDDFGEAITEADDHSDRTQPFELNLIVDDQLATKTSVFNSPSFVWWPAEPFTPGDHTLFLELGHGWGGGEWPWVLGSDTGAKYQDPDWLDEGISGLIRTRIYVLEA